ncbi:MAG: hypothetical protein KatS3mg124_1575 [Porticoccaceae bacterium]|nr:MAG: hypothetical protein KatS3mg124_1575 [Porticoccaceae bacterium]
MSGTWLVAVVQVAGNRGLTGNLEAAAHWLERAAAQGARLVALPENFAYHGERDLARAAAAEHTPQGPARAFLAERARALKIWLLGGTVPIPPRPGDKPFAASLLFSPAGEEVARYDKIHLFDVELPEGGRSYRESRDYRPGDAPAWADLPGFRLGLSVCYDLRFPELYRKLSREGATVLAVPSAFTLATGRAHWMLLLRARAVENLCYVLAPNLADRDHPRRPTWGESAIVDPWGEVLARLDGEEGMALAELDFARQEALRRALPALEHRRLFQC